MAATEWLDDRVAVCNGSHITQGPLGIVYFEGGQYLKMCQECYERVYPTYQWDHLEKC
jgi:hypothetical protein